jgi:hypothetical protein
VKILFWATFNIVAGLWIEKYGARHGLTWTEPFVATVTLLHFGYYLIRPPPIFSSRISRTTLLVCLGLATFGELILSAVWGVYKYRVSVLPAFVPPGHVLVFLSGLAIASDERCKRWIVLAVPLVALVPISHALFMGKDVLSLPLFAVFLGCLIWGRDPKLYAVMFVLALGLEFLGTGMGAWVWAPTLPGLDFHSANPPIAAGVFYALLDLLTVRLTGIRLSADKVALESIKL